MQPTRRDRSGEQDSSSTVTTDAPSHDRTPCALFRRFSTSKLKPPGRANARYQVEDVCGERGEQWYGGPGGASRASGTSVRTGAACHHDRAGLVRSGWASGPTAGMDDDPEWSWREAMADRRLASCSRSPDPDPGHTGRLIWGTLAGACLVAFGLGLAYLVIGTPLVAQLLPGSPTGSSQVGWVPLVWVTRSAAGVALLVAGTNRLAFAVASVQRSDARAGPPVMRVMGDAARRPARLARCRSARRPTDPGTRDRAIRGRHRPGSRGPRPTSSGRHLVGDADSRRLGPDGASGRPSSRATPIVSATGSTHGDLDYVVRVYAALVTPDATIARTPLCAVLSDESDPRLARGTPPPAQLQRRAAEPPADTGPRGLAAVTRRRAASLGLVGEPGST